MSGLSPRAGNIGEPLRTIEAPEPVTEPLVEPAPETAPADPAREPVPVP